MRQSKSEWLGAILIVVLSMIIGAIAFAPDAPPPRVVTETDTVAVTIIDYIDKDPIVIEREVAIRETIYVSVGGDSITTEAATIDTLFSDSAYIAVSYFITPRVFKIDYTPAPVEVREITITKEHTAYVDTSAWWDKAKYGFGVGLTTTALLVSLLK